MQTYRAHEASREAIELAFDAILQEKMKVRAKYGFRPPRTGRKTDAAGDDLVRCILACIPYVERSGVPECKGLSAICPPCTVEVVCAWPIRPCRG